MNTPTQTKSSSGRSAIEFHRLFSETIFSDTDLSGEPKESSDTNRLISYLSGSDATNDESAALKRLSIYRNNVFFSLSSALADLYPVVKLLVGEEFFAAVAKEYIRAHPPVSAAMVSYGRRFADFLRGFEHTSSLKWLHEMAELELLRHDSYHAEDRDSLSIVTIGQISIERLLQTRFEFVPSFKLFRSSFPLVKVWESNQPDSDSSENSIDLNSGGDFILVYRQEFEVLLETVPEPEQEFLNELISGEKLAKALEQFGEEEQLAAQALARLINRNIIFQIQEETDG